MLGEKIWEGTGKRIVRRVLSIEPPTVEVTFETAGKLLGINCGEMATYTSVVRPDGTIFGEGQGAIMTEAGEMIAWKGAGVGTFGERGAVSYRGAVYFSTTSPNFIRLNRVAGVFEYQADADGKTHSTTWEWK
jgi:hypothetical protein